MGKKYFDPLPSSEIPSEHRSTFAKYRALAIGHGVEAGVPLCYKVRAGFTLKKHAPRAGPCYEDFQYLRGWDFEDNPTQSALVFWVPRLVSGGTSKPADEQHWWLAHLRQRLELPEHHLSSFGQVSLVAGLILAHFKNTGERVPLGRSYACTATYSTPGGHLNLGSFGGLGLRCGNWCWSGSQGGDVGVFALGIEPLA